jgi:UDP-N-acetylglucosamine 2-epimerase (non-hydrolysing)
MKKCNLIVSDSGGIQEEATAPSIRKKVLVLRTSTERIEAVESGYAEIIGVNPYKIANSIRKNFDNPAKLTKNPYGFGKTSEKIINILKKNI